MLVSRAELPPRATDWLHHLTSACLRQVLGGVFTLDSASPIANTRPHYSNSRGSHLYYYRSAPPPSGTAFGRCTQFRDTLCSSSTIHAGCSTAHLESVLTARSRLSERSSPACALQGRRRVVVPEHGLQPRQLDLPGLDWIGRGRAGPGPPPSGTATRGGGGGGILAHAFSLPTL